MFWLAEQERTLSKKNQIPASVAIAVGFFVPLLGIYFVFCGLFLKREGSRWESRICSLWILALVVKSGLQTHSSMVACREHILKRDKTFQKELGGIKITHSKNRGKRHSTLSYAHLIQSDPIEFFFFFFRRTLTYVHFIQSKPLEFGAKLTSPQKKKTQKSET
jgi:hypothetical protein